MDKPHPKSLKKLVRNGLTWSAASTIGRQCVQFGSLVILARILAPADYGLVAMSAAVLGFGGLLSNVGLGLALVHREKCDADHVSTCYWFSLCLGALTTFIFYNSASLVETFYRNDMVVEVFRVSSLTILMRASLAADKSVLTRNMEFKNMAVVELVAQVVSNILAILLALKGFGALSLAIRGLVEGAFESLSLGVLRRWKLRFIVSARAFRDLWSFAGGQFGARVLQYCTRNADSIIVGRFLGDLQLGYYNMAYRILYRPFQVFNAATFRVLFSSFSRLQSDPERFRRGYVLVTENVCKVFFPVGVLFLVLGQDIVILLAGEKWATAGPVLQVFGLTILLQSVGAAAGHVYLGKGRTDLLLRWAALSSTLHVAAFIVGAQFGIFWVAFGYMLVQALLLLPRVYVAGGLIGLKMSELFKAAHVPLAASATGGCVAFVLRHALPADWGYVAAFSLSLMVLAVVFAAVATRLQPRFFHDLWFMNGI